MAVMNDEETVELGNGYVAASELAPCSLFLQQLIQSLLCHARRLVFACNVSCRRRRRRCGWQLRYVM